MVQFAQLMFYGFIVLTLLYAGVSIYSRLERRRKLIKQWKAEGRIGDRETYIREGLEDYDDSFRKKLILLIYIVPVVVVVVIIYLVNFY